MCAKRKKNNFVLISSVAVVSVIAICLAIFLVVRGMSADDDSSDSTSSSQSDSSSEDSSSENSEPEDSDSEDQEQESDSDEEDSIAGPLRPSSPDSDEEDGDGEEAEDSEEPESTTAPQTTAPPQTTRAPQTTAPPQTTRAPQTTAPPQTTRAPQTTAPPQTTAAPVVTLPPATTAKPTPLDPPEATVSTTNADAFHVSWDEVENASGYKVSVFRGSSSTAVEEKTLSASTTSYTTNTKRADNTTYSIKVQALGKGEYSNSDLRVLSIPKKSSTISESQKLSAPTNLSATVSSKGAISAEWNSVDRADEYEVELFDPNGKRIESTTTTRTYYTFDEYAEEEGSYRVRVKAMADNHYTDSDYVTQSVRSRTSDSSDKLAAPKNLKISQRTDHYRVSWDDDDKAAEYSIEIVDPNGDIVCRSTEYYSPHECYEDFNLKGSYTVRVKAISDDFDYDDSNWATIKFSISRTRLDTPDNLDASYENGKITVSWDRVTDADSYTMTLYRDGKKIRTKTVERNTGVGAGQKRVTGSFSSSDVDSGEEYTIRVSAVSNDESLKNSDYAECEIST